MPDALDLEIAAYEKMEEELAAHHLRKFVIFYKEQLAGVYDTFDTAARVAMKKFGRGPYLIRQVRGLPARFPPSLAFRLSHASD